MTSKTSEQRDAANHARRATSEMARIIRALSDERHPLRLTPEQIDAVKAAFAVCRAAVKAIEE